MKKTVIKVLLLALVVVFALGVLAGCATDPKQQLRNAVNKTVEKVQNSKIIELTEKMKNGGSVELTAGLDEILSAAMSLSGAPADISTDITLSLKEYCNLKDVSGAFTADMLIGGTSAVNFAYILKKDVATVSSTLLPGGPYGAVLENFSENLKKSDIYAYISESSLKDIFTAENANAFMSGEEYAQLEKLVDKYYNLVLDILLDNGKIETADEQVQIGSETATATKYVLTFDHDTLVAMAETLVAELKSDEKVNAAVESIAAQEEMTAEEFWAAVDGLIAEAKAVPEEDKAGEVRLVVYVNTKLKTVMKAVVESSLKGLDTFAVSVVFGVNPEKPAYSEFALSYGEQSFALAYTVKTDTDKAFLADVSVKADGASVITFEIDYDKETGAYEVSAKAGLMKVAAKGTFVLTDKELAFTLSEVSAGVVTVSLPVTLTVKAKDDMPAAPAEYTDITKMTKAEIESLAEKINSDMVQLFENLPDDVKKLLETASR